MLSGLRPGQRRTAKKRSIMTNLIAPILRRQCIPVRVGDVVVGGGPIVVQSMTNTLTTDIKATINQINSLEEAGADIVRVACPDEESTKALKNIIIKVEIPIVADIHFHYKRAIEAAEMGASCLRINPGNIGTNDRVLEVVKAAKDNNCSIRMGVNEGSLDKNLLEKYKELLSAIMADVLRKKASSVTRLLRVGLCQINSPDFMLTALISPSELLKKIFSSTITIESFFCDLIKEF